MELGSHAVALRPKGSIRVGPKYEVVPIRADRAGTVTSDLCETPFLAEEGGQEDGPEHEAAGPTPRRLERTGQIALPLPEAREQQIRLGDRLVATDLEDEVSRE
jgi:hypothetical protein